jgi:ATP-dependent Lhr-like helicase
MTTSQPSSSEGGDQPSAAFERLHERVRRWIWEQKWTTLRDVQERTIHAILDGKGDIVIAATTASGKTEAAFLPICSQLVETASPGIQALYISPLKALINDQFRRLDQLCEHLEIPVHRWHGDVDAGKKQKILREPRGILLITPESLEALFVLRGPEVRRLLGGVRFVVVDELHAFMGVERGRQVQSLLHRLELAVRHRIRRIGLSATIGDMNLAAEFLRPGAGSAVETIVSTEGDQELRLQVRGYERPIAEPVGKRRRDALATDAPEAPEEPDSEDDLSIADHLFKVLRGTHNLVFANARTQVEHFADLLRRRCEALGVPNEFWPHHGNLSRELRQDVEAMLKERERPVTAVCTSTLELGIDIGNVSSIAQLGPPPSVASLRQRLGRSGRRGDPAVLRVYIREDTITPESAPQDLLRLQLVESLAIVELLLRHWYEPPTVGRLHLSTLVQQVLSLIAQHGGVRATEAWEALCKTGPFAEVSAPMFTELLRSLGAYDLLTQSGDGTLLLGVKGERMVNRYDFYAAFSSPEEYRLVANGKPLGTLPVSEPILEGTTLVFAGRRWRVFAFDQRDRVIDVTASKAGRAPSFAGGGSGAVHDEVRRKMFQILMGADVPAYLDPVAQRLLAQGRSNFQRLGLASRRHIRLGTRSYLFPWKGDRATNTTAVHLRALDFDAGAEDGVVVVSDAAEDALAVSLKRLAEAGPVDAVSLAEAVLNKVGEKYDEFLTERLLCEEYARRELDPVGAWEAISEIAAEAERTSA